MHENKVKGDFIDRFFISSKIGEHKTTVKHVKTFHIRLNSFNQCMFSFHTFGY